MRISEWSSDVCSSDLDPPSFTHDHLEVTATAEDGVIMGLQHRTLPIYGVQFHPESIASQEGHALLLNFLKLADPAAAACSDGLKTGDSSMSGEMPDLKGLNGKGAGGAPLTPAGAEQALDAAR